MFKHYFVTKAYVGVEVQLPSFLTFALRGRWVVCFKSGEWVPYPSDRRVSGPNCRYGTAFVVNCVWNVMAHGDARQEKWTGNKRMEWVTSKRHMTAEHRLARAGQTLQADVHSSAASSRLNRRPCRFKWTRPFRRKTKSGFCACAITFHTQSTV
jgi:hypothetical protein